MNRSLATATGLAIGLALIGLGPGCSETCQPPPDGTLGAPTAWEQEFLAGPGLPTPPSASTLPGDDGLMLAYADWVPDGWDGQGPVVVLVHGSSAYGELYGVLGQGLARRGVLARLLDLRGHGRSACPTPQCNDRQAPRTYEDDGAYWPGRPGDSLDDDQIVRDLHAFVEDARQRWPQAQIWLAGHSSGGGVVARYVEQTGMAHLDGAMQLAPFHHADQPQNSLQSWDCGRGAGTGYARVDLGALGDAMRGNPHRYVMSFHKDPEYLTELDTLRYSYTTMLGVAASGPDSFHAAFTKPTLWVVGEDDLLFDLEASREEFDRLASPGAFVVVRETSHIGVSWSDAVAGLMADFAWDPSSVSSGSIDPE